MLSQRNPGNRASDIYRERYSREYKTTNQWEGMWGVVDPCVYTPSRSSLRSRGQGSPSPARSLNGTLLNSTSGSGTYSNEASPLRQQPHTTTLPNLPSPPAPTSHFHRASPAPSPSSPASSAKIHDAMPQVPKSPVRTARRNYRHMTAEGRRNFYAQFIAKPDSEYTKAVTESFSSKLPSV